MNRSGWIRSWSWDSLWILSGLPVGALFYGAAKLIGEVNATLILVMAIAMGHNFSPMVVAWTHDQFRAKMLNEKFTFISVPLMMLTLTLAICICGWLGLCRADLHFELPNPHYPIRTIDGIMLTLWVFTVWNAWHFGGQCFGILTLYRQRSGKYPRVQRTYDRIFSLCIFLVLIPSTWYLAQVRAFGSILPFLPPFDSSQFLLLRNIVFALSFGLLAVMLYREASARTFCVPRLIYIATQCATPLCFFVSVPAALQVFSTGHGLASIGLSAHIIANRKTWNPLIVALGLIGLSILTYGFVSASMPVSQSAGSQDLSQLSLFLILMFGVRFFISFCHFHYERKLYKFSDPSVRETIGRDLLQSAPSSAPPQKLSA